MSKQQTSVDWLIEQLIKRDKDFNPSSFAIQIYFESSRNLVEQAKQMEKEQIKSSYNQGYRDADCDCYKSVGADVAKFEDSEKYYNETFGK